MGRGSICIIRSLPYTSGPEACRRGTISRDLRTNEGIRVREVRLIGENGEQLGVLPVPEALSIARERGLDLVEVAPTAVPPVCRLLDYGRFKYEQEKKDREARKNQKTVLMKEIRLRPKTDEHDIDFKTKQIERFVEEGDKVKVTIRFRGREMVHPNVGRQLLEVVAERVKDVAVVERMPLMEGNTMTMILSKGKGAPAAARPAEPSGPAGPRLAASAESAAPRRPTPSAEPAAPPRRAASAEPATSPRPASRAEPAPPRPSGP